MGKKLSEKNPSKRPLARAARDNSETFDDIFVHTVCSYAAREIFFFFFFDASLLPACCQLIRKVSSEENISLAPARIIPIPFLTSNKEPKTWYVFRFWVGGSVNSIK